jgi:AcrR family transcriptional regulator
MAASTRQRLIEAMFECSIRNGFHAVGIDRVLEAAGVSKQTFYNHFESKDDLVLATIQHRHVLESRQFAEMLEKAGGASPRGQLLAIFEVLDAWFNDPAFNGCIFLTAAAEFPQPGDPAHQAAAQHLMATEQKLCHMAAAAGAREPLALAQQILTLMEGSLLMRHIVGNRSSAKIARTMAEVLLEKYLPAGEQVGAA